MTRILEKTKELFGVKEGKIMFYKKIVKRIADVLLASFTLIIASPIMLISAILIKLDSKGPVIFKQKRIGLNGNPFSIYKFRTMYHDVKFGENKPTRIGKFLRKTSIDELPQLVNILKGEMSFIGPRPWITEYSKYFTDREKKRWQVLPGLSGWAQIKGRNGITVREKLDADAWYVDNISFKVDIEIFFKTIFLVFKKSNSSISENGIINELDYLRSNFEKQQTITEVSDIDEEQKVSEAM